MLSNVKEQNERYFQYFKELNLSIRFDVDNKPESEDPKFNQDPTADQEVTACIKSKKKQNHRFQTILQL